MSAMAAATRLGRVDSSRLRRPCRSGLPAARAAPASREPSTAACSPRSSCRARAPATVTNSNAFSGRDRRFRSLRRSLCSFRSKRLHDLFGLRPHRRATPRALGQHDRRTARSTHRVELVVHDDVVVLADAADLGARRLQPPLDRCSRCPCCGRAAAARAPRTTAAARRRRPPRARALRTCRAPWTSITSTRSRPPASTASVSAAARAVEVAEHIGPLEKAAARRPSPRSAAR